MKIISTLAALFVSAFAFSQTIMTYNIPFSQTIGLQMTSGDICSAPFTIEEAFQASQGNTWGCTWTSTNTGVATSVEVTVAFTVTDGGGNFPTTLNGVASNNVTDGTAKNCEPSTILTWTIDPSSYMAGTTNTFLVDFATATNISQVDNLPFEPDSYMQVTVVYDTCSTIDTTVSQNGNTLTSNATNATYQWIDCATGSTISGATDSSYTPTATGEYGVVITDNSSGCSDTSVCTQVTVSGISEYISGTVSIYPNPAHDKLSVDLTDLYGSTRIIIYDIQGREVMTKNVIAGQPIVLDLDALKRGVYHLKAISEKKTATARFILE